MIVDRQRQLLAVPAGGPGRDALAVGIAGPGKLHQTAKGESLHPLGEPSSRLRAVEASTRSMLWKK